MVGRWGFWAALGGLIVLGAGVAQAQPKPGQFGREHERLRQAEPPRAAPPRPEMRADMRPQVPPPMRPEMRPVVAPFQQPPAPFYAPPPFRGGGWSSDDGGPAAWDVRAAQDNFNQIVLELQQEHNDGVVQLQQEFNAGQISREQMDFGIAELGRRYDEAVAYQQQILYR